MVIESSGSESRLPGFEVYSVIDWLSVRKLNTLCFNFLACKKKNVDGKDNSNILATP